MSPKKPPVSNIFTVQAEVHHDWRDSMDNSHNSKKHNMSNGQRLRGYINKGFVLDGVTTTTQSEATEPQYSGLTMLELIERNQKISQTPMGTVQRKSIVNFDAMLSHVGEFGCYQKLLFLMMLPFAVFIAFVYFSQIFMTVVPQQHWCRVPELAHLTLDERRSLAIPVHFGQENIPSYSKCSMYAINYTAVLANNTRKADPSWPTQPCLHGWEYNFTDIPYETAGTELGMVCANEYLSTLAQVIFFLGSIFGGALFGRIADQCGRVPALTGSNMVGFVAGFGTAFVTNFWQFAFCRFLVGFAFSSCFTIMYILVLEYVGPRWRTFAGNMSIGLFFTAGSCALPWMAFYLADWRMFAIATSTPLALSILTPMFVPESPRWLVSNGNLNKAIGILRKMEKLNKKTVDPKLYREFRESCILRKLEEVSTKKSHSMLDLFGTPRLRTITILLMLTWMMISLVFDGHVRYVGSFGPDMFIIFTVAAATKLPADMFLTLTFERWGRRWMAFGTMVTSGVFSLLATTVPTGVYSTTLAIFGRLCVNISFNIGLQYAAELMPTVVRAQGIAIIHIMGYVASITGPFVVQLARIAPSIPLIVLGVLGIIGGLLALLLPETLRHELPETLTDGEDFGRGQKFWDAPCVERKDSDDNDVLPVERFTLNSPRRVPVDPLYFHQR